MISLSSILAFGAVSAVIIATPGPSVLFVISRTVAFGRRVGLLTVAGNAVGLTVQVVAVAAGLAALLQQSITVYTAVKFAGALYLVWLGIQAIRSRASLQNGADEEAAPKTTFAILQEGFVVGTLNPKSLALFAAFMPQFIPSDTTAPTLNVAVLGAVFITVALVLDSIWALAAGSARTWFAGSPRRVRVMKTVSGSIMIALGLNLALERP